MNATYIPRSGKFAGQKGKMVGRVCDTSNNDIKLQFECGSQRWFTMNDVQRSDVCRRCGGTKEIKVPHQHSMWCYKETTFCEDILVCSKSHDPKCCPECVGE